MNLRTNALKSMQRRLDARKGSPLIQIQPREATEKSDLTGSWNEF